MSVDDELLIEKGRDEIGRPIKLRNVRHARVLRTWPNAPLGIFIRCIERCVGSIHPIVPRGTCWILETAIRYAAVTCSRRPQTTCSTAICAARLLSDIRSFQANTNPANTDVTAITRKCNEFTSMSAVTFVISWKSTF